MSELTRRSFLKGMLAVGASAAAFGLTGAVPTARAEGEEAEEKVIAEVLEKDIVIVGAGAAGMLAAYAAGKEGAENVLVISNSPNANTTNGSKAFGDYM